MVNCVVEERSFCLDNVENRIEPTIYLVNDLEGEAAYDLFYFVDGL